MRFVEVLLNYVPSFCFALLDDFIAVSREVDPLPLGEAFRFDNVSLLLDLLPLVSLIKLGPKVLRLLRQQPGPWKEFVLLRECPLHLHQISSKKVFPGNHVHSGILVDLLVRLHLTEKISRYTQIVP